MKKSLFSDMTGVDTVFGSLQMDPTPEKCYYAQSERVMCFQPEERSRQPFSLKTIRFVR
jgi:hypothetical protein